MNYLRVKWKINAEIKRSKVYIIKREWGITVLFLLILIEINLQEFARVHMSKFRWIFNRTNGNSVEEFKKKKKEATSCAEARGTLKWNERERCNELLTPGRREGFLLPIGE